MMTLTSVDVHESIYDKFVERIGKLVNQMKQGPTCDCGSMTMPAQVDIVEAAIKDAVEKGAKVICGGKRNVALGGAHAIICPACVRAEGARTTTNPAHSESCDEQP